MNEIELIGKCFPCRAEELHSFETIKAGPLRFTVQRYTVEGVGNLSVMDGVGMLGLMKMKTAILTPLQKDAPLFSYDRIIAMGNDAIIIELYDTMISSDTAEFEKNSADFNALKNGYASLPEHDLGSHWYDSLKLPSSISKKGKHKACSETFDGIYTAYLTHYLAWLAVAPVCDRNTKSKVEERYVSGLLENGGASTDAFIKAIGKEKTAELFRKVLFGTTAAASDTRE